MSADPPVPTFFVSQRPSPSRVGQPIEDRWSCTNLEEENVQLVGVYDGHGGPETAVYISEAIPRAFRQQRLAHPEKSIEACFEDAFQEVDREITGAVLQQFGKFLRSYVPDAIRRSLINAKLDKNKALRDMVRRARSGSTALAVYVNEKAIITANVGDCRAVLARFDPATNSLQAMPLTEDQDGNNLLEAARIRAEHDQEEWETLFVRNRLFGQIPLTRSFGDAFYKYADTNITRYVFSAPSVTKPKTLPYDQAMEPYYQFIKSAPYLTATPLITSYARSAEYDHFVVLASDGLWSVKGVSNEWVVTKVYEALEGNLADPSAYVMRELEPFHPVDDVTIEVVMLMEY